MEQIGMLTTIDNPYSPHTDFDRWLSYDITSGYNTCGLLDSIVGSTVELPDAIETELIQLGMQTILSEDTLGIYVIVYK